MNANTNTEVIKMSHNTEIRQTEEGCDVILSVGKTAKDGKIYINIRHYHQDDVIDAGDITISHAEWNLINTNLNRNTEKTFICPECGDIVTEDEIMESLTSGGYGMCMCEFGNGQRILVPYESYTPDDSITPGEMELIRIIRRFYKE